MKINPEINQNDNIVNNSTEEAKNATIKNQSSMSSDFFTKKFIVNKNTYKNLVVMATDKFYDVDTNNNNIIELTSNMLNSIIDEAFTKYKQEKSN